MGGEEGWPTTPSTTEKKNDPELKKALTPVNVIFVNDDVLGSNNVLEYVKRTEGANITLPLQL